MILYIISKVDLQLWRNNNWIIFVRFGCNALTTLVDTTQYMVMIQAIRIILVPDSWREIRESYMHGRVILGFWEEQRPLGQMAVSKHNIYKLDTHLGRLKRSPSFSESLDYKYINWEYLFADYHDAVFVVGALDETLILRGMRYHPIDIENSVMRAHKKIAEWLVIIFSTYFEPF